MITLVSTPIGNLGDITLRAIEALKSADVIACEDTRKTAVLLRHLDIKKPMVAFHEHNELASAAGLINLCEQGKHVAVVSDAGTPGIADPGYTVVRKALECGIAITMAPGPSAVIMALVLSGLPSHSFLFRGFTPRKSGQRQRFFGEDAEQPHTVIYYESPHRLKAAVQDAYVAFGDRDAALANDLTKHFELIIRCTLGELESRLPTTLKGEFVLVIAGKAPAKEDRRDRYSVD